ncbi:MAG: SUMF1/EgtB/PvdO family nonheme iron enzyme [Pseudomonadota bacterium]|nr:SUMF1/EgtB/PvdO family nonheme iron enzyme [Pseudomonadota bacterium]
MDWLTPTATRIRREGAAVVRAPAGPLEPLVEAALRHGGGLVVLGVFGSGKTELARRVGGRLSVPVIPLRVVARAKDRAATLAALLNGSEAAILDGLDEIGRPDHCGAAELFAWLIARVPRWVVTSRPGHFRTDLADPDPGQVDALHLPMVEFAPYPLPPDAPVFCGDNAVLLSLWLRGARGDTPAALVEDHLAPTRAIDALEDLAWHSLVGLDPSHEGGSFVAGELAGLPAWLFVEDLDGRFRFGHRSLYDALVARRLARRLVAGQGGGPDDLTGLVLSGAMRAFLAGAFGGWEHDADWVSVPRGNFVSGGARSADERPLVVKHLARGVLVARRPVTNAAFQAFLDATGPRPPWVGRLSHWRLGRCPDALADHPVMMLRPDDCDAFAAWAASTGGAGARLPTADEWEKAVRGWDGRHFPWGDRFDPTRANTAECGRDATAPVTTYPQGSGLYGAIGDAFECTSSRYRDRPDRGRVVLGGSYAHTALRASLRLSHTLSGRLKIGLRLARDS